MIFLDTNKYAAIRYVGDMIPIAGRGTPICPPTYIPEGPGGNRFSYSKEHPVPNTDKGKDGEYLTGPDGEQILRPAVIVNSLGAEARLIEQSIKLHEPELGIQLPGIYIDPPAPDDVNLKEIVRRCITKKSGPFTEKSLAEALLNDLNSAQASTWTTPHRHTDTYIRHAEFEGEQIWSNPNSDPHMLIANASRQRGDILFRYFPNSALMGFWLSATAPRRHKLARALSSVITGFDAQEVKRAATKSDPLGGISSKVKMVRNANRAISISSREKGKDPSTFGLGQVPTANTTQAFSCSVILRQSTISLNQLKRIEYPSFEVHSPLVTQALAWLGVIGLCAIRDQGFLRSGCDLITGKQGSQFSLIDYDGSTSLFEVDLETAIINFREVYDCLPKELQFADPIHTTYPAALIEARAETLIEEATKNHVKESK